MRILRIAVPFGVLLFSLTHDLLADATGVEAVDATDQQAQALGLSVCQVFVEFDNPDDKLLSIGFANIRAFDPAGFWQHPQQPLPTSPACGLIPLYPDLVYDSYVTIGVTCNDGTDGTTLDPDFDITLFQSGGAIVGGWYNSDRRRSSKAGRSGERVGHKSGSMIMPRGFSQITPTLGQGLSINLRFPSSIGIAPSMN